MFEASRVRRRRFMTARRARRTRDEQGVEGNRTRAASLIAPLEKPLGRAPAISRGGPAAFCHIERAPFNVTEVVTERDRTHTEELSFSAQFRTKPATASVE
jgi:hypothetical protein